MDVNSTLNSLNRVAAKVLVVAASTVFSAQAQAQFRLPVEVLGEEGTTVTETFNLTSEQVNRARRLFFHANNLSYENKGAIRVNGGDWINLNHDNVRLYSKEETYGGMQHGGMNSIRFTIPSRDLVVGENNIRFRFRRADGLSIGYRIFEFNLRDRQGRNILPSSFFERDNPDDWRRPRDFRNSEAVERGRDLWYSARLFNHDLPNRRVATWYGNNLLPRQRIRATCSDCHTQDGRDLEYFAYSNRSIIERSKFHGLNDTQGRQIAAYIRSLDVPRHGRPWNPPYQPGPAIGRRGIARWAAGAGIDAVLETDAEMLPYMFPNGTSQSEVDAYFDSDRMYDTTTVPVSVQFPDWKHWLPMIHPLDAFGDFYAVSNGDGTFSPGDADEAQNPFVQYPRLRRFLENNNHNRIVERSDRFYELLGDFWRSFRQFFTDRIGRRPSGHWRTKDSVANEYMEHTENGFGQFTRTSLARLMAVKFFELHQEFRLDQINQRLIPAEDQPAPRQWVHSFGYNVFEVPAHFTGTAFGSEVRFVGQPRSTGLLETSTWYELQLVLNPGNGRAGLTGPVDFNYHPGFIRKSAAGNRPHPLRYYRAMNNAYQVKSHSRALREPNNKRRGFIIHQQGPRNILPIDVPGFDGTAFTETLDDIEPGLARKVVNAMTRQLADTLHRPENHPDTYPRSASPDRYQLDQRDKSSYDENSRTNADQLYRYIGQFTEFGVSRRRITRVIDWCETAWPNMDWGAARRQN